MKYAAIFLAAVFVAGLAGTWYFWPSGQDQEAAAFFSFLQFVAAFGLILLTFVYVRTAQKQLADQNRPPRIAITGHYYPQVDPFVLSFDVEIANPAVKATSLSLTSVQVGIFIARDAYFEVSQAQRSRVTGAAQDLVSTSVKATNFDPPGVPIAIGLKTRATLLFNDIFHGALPPVIIEV